LSKKNILFLAGVLIFSTVLLLGCTQLQPPTAGDLTNSNPLPFGKFFDLDGNQLGYCTSVDQGGYMNPQKVTYFDMNYIKINECSNASNSGGFKGGCISDENTFLTFGSRLQDSNVIEPQGLKYTCLFD